MGARPADSSARTTASTVVSCGRRCWRYALKIQRVARRLHASRVGHVLVVLAAVAAALAWPLVHVCFDHVFHVSESDIVRRGVQADAAVVLGFDIGDPQLLSPTLRARARAALHLVNERWVDSVLLTGGIPQGGTVSEAAAVHRWMVAQGLRADAGVHLEANSSSTIQNARYSMPVIKAREWKHIVLVTSPYHTWRALRVFRAEVRRALGDSAPKVSVAPHSILLDSGHHSSVGLREGVRELLATAMYAVAGWL